MTLRGSVLEDAIPSTAKHSTARGLPLKEVLEHVIPELNIQCLRLAFNTPKVTEQLMKLDEQGVSVAWRTFFRLRFPLGFQSIDLHSSFFDKENWCHLLWRVFSLQLLIFFFLGFLNSEHFSSDEILYVSIDGYIWTLCNSW